MKAREIITRAHAEVVASRSQIVDGELQDGLRYLNRMMAKFTSKGIDVGYTSLSSLDDDLTSNPLSYLGIVKNLAKSLWAQYRADPINPVLEFSAKRSLDTMRIIASNFIEAAQYPDTFPKGSGNSNPPYDEKYYTNEIEQTTYIAVERDDQ